MEPGQPAWPVPLRGAELCSAGQPLRLRSGQAQGRLSLREAGIMGQECPLHTGSEGAEQVPGFFVAVEFGILAAVLAIGRK